MRIAIVANPRSGRGRAAGACESLARGLARDGHEVQQTPPRSVEELALETRGCDALIAVGGDGTCALAAAACVRHGAALWPYPMGTENLFAKHLGAVADAEDACRVIGAGATRRMDVGTIDGDAIFLLMTSIGPDAGVVDRLTQRRRGAISHLSYVAPIVEEALRPTLPGLTIDADGERIVTATRGMVVVANIARYALGINPAPDARADDGLLDVVFMPSGNTVAAAAWLIQAKAGQHVNRASIVTRRARRVVIRPDRACVFQADGDPGSVVRPRAGLVTRTTGLELGVLTNGLLVFTR